MFVDWLTTLFDATGFLTRGHCGRWSVSLMLVYISSNALISFSYIIIAVCLTMIWSQRRHDIKFGWVLSLFAGFITACGLTHACDVAVFWWPGYRLFSVFTAITAAFAMVTALVLPGVTRTILNLPTPAVFQDVNRELQSAIALKDEANRELAGTVAALRRQVDHLERMRQTGLWVAEQESALRELKTVLASSSTREAPR